jgi:hypothetical protein
VKIFADRDGDQVTGRVDFPYNVYGRSSVPIHYRSARPGEPRTSVRADSLTGRARARLDLVNHWNSACDRFPAITRLQHAENICKSAPIKCSPRSLQAWATKFRLEGVQGLIENYTPAPRKKLSLTAEIAAQAVQTCAWWAFRIGNVDAIDSKMMHAAAALCSASPFDKGGTDRPGREIGRGVVGPILAAIDRYYSWLCDRRKMPFKPFARWAKYDYDRWLLRAADLQVRQGGTTAIDPAYRDGNFQHPHAAFTDHPVPLWNPVASVPDGLAASLPPAPRTRARDTRDRATVQAIAARSGPRTSVRADSIEAILGPLDDAWRSMLLRASFKDSDAVAQAVATLPIWWPLIDLPAQARERIDRATFIRPSERRPGDDAKLARAKVQMLIAELRSLRKVPSS